MNELKDIRHRDKNDLKSVIFFQYKIFLSVTNFRQLGLFHFSR